MTDLMHRCYDHVDPTRFADDLAAKKWVLTLRDTANNHLVGFSTQTLVDANVDGQPITALFSGDTVVSREYWGQRDLLLGAAFLVDKIMSRVIERRLYWFLISKGYKTYHFLPVLFRKFYPSRKAATPKRVKRVIDVLGNLLGGERYNSQRGIIQNRGEGYVLKQDIAEMTKERTGDANADFFLSMNPGFETGDELCCVAELHPSNFTNVSRRLLQTHKHLTPDAAEPV